MARDYTQELIAKVKENYLSVALGILVFLVAVTLVFRSGNSTNQPSPEKEETPKVRTYTVKKGDSVSSIARDQLGSMDYTDELVRANNIKNPDQIDVGIVLVLPEISGQVARDEEKPTTAPTQVIKPTLVPQIVSITGNEYTVKKGDTLFLIAQRAYGDGYTYPTLVKANKLRNANRIEVGMILKIPRETTK